MSWWLSRAKNISEFIHKIFQCSSSCKNISLKMLTLEIICVLFIIVDVGTSVQTQCYRQTDYQRDVALLYTVQWCTVYSVWQVVCLVQVVNTPDTGDISAPAVVISGSGVSGVTGHCCISTRSHLTSETIHDVTGGLILSTQPPPSSPGLESSAQCDTSLLAAKWDWFN